MGQSTPLIRQFLFTDASLTVAAARHRGHPLDLEAEARRILAAHPASGLTEADLIKAMFNMLDAVEPVSTAGVLSPELTRDEDHAALNLSREGPLG